MKSIKYTLAAIAVIALASVSTAKAVNDGEVILGVFNSTNSLEFDLGSYSTITGQTSTTWNLGNVSSVAGSGLSFSFAAAATSFSAQGGVPKLDIAVAGANIVTPSGAVTGEESAINTVASNFGGGTAETPITGTGLASYQEELLPSTASGNYNSKDNGNGFGLGYNIDETFTGNDTAELYLLGNGTLSDIGTFTTVTTAGDTVLTFTGLTATPEPSAYALGLCAVALFFVLKRRRTVA